MPSVIPNMSGQTEVRFTWINANGLNSNLRGGTISDFLDEFTKSDYDCIMIQEPRCKIDKQSCGGYNWEYPCARRKR